MTHTSFETHFVDAMIAAMCLFFFTFFAFLFMGKVEEPSCPNSEEVYRQFDCEDGSSHCD